MTETDTFARNDKWRCIFCPSPSSCLAANCHTFDCGPLYAVHSLQPHRHVNGKCLNNSTPRFVSSNFLLAGRLPSSRNKLLLLHTVIRIMHAVINNNNKNNGTFIRNSCQLGRLNILAGDEQRLMKLRCEQRIGSRNCCNRFGYLFGGAVTLPTNYCMARWPFHSINYIVRSARRKREFIRMRLVADVRAFDDTWKRHKRPINITFHSHAFHWKQWAAFEELYLATVAASIYQLDSKTSKTGFHSAFVQLSESVKSRWCNKLDALSGKSSVSNSRMIYVIFNVAILFPR